MSDRTWHAIITAVIGLVVLVILRVTLGILFDRYLRHVAERRSPDDVARLRTRLMVIRRIVLIFVFIVVLWSVLEIFPGTERFARTLLASSAFIALVIGVAFSVPLGNIGAGILLSLTQPVRIGDRISVGTVTGVAEEITLIHTVVRTDEGRVAFVPNSQMIMSTVVNRSLDDPRRTVSVRLPIAITASVDEARQLLLKMVDGLPDGDLEGARVLVGEVAERTTWLTISGYTPRGATIDHVAGELRERGLAVLARENLLPE
jgi:small-conductance mechanosensitive channel